MELKEIIKFFETNYKIIGVSTILAAFIGVAGYFLLPQRYYATGSLFVRRSIYPYSETHFTYEGYYGQQAAMAYTNSVIGLIKSQDVRALALENLGTPVNEDTLRKYGRKIKTVKSGPQLIELRVKEDSPTQAEKVWKAVSDSTIEVVNKISRQNDPFVGVIKVSEEPIVKRTYRNIPICFTVGAALGFVLSTGILSLKSYFPKNKKWFKKKK